MENFVVKNNLLKSIKINSSVNIQEILCKYDYHIFSSKYEGFPNAILQSLFCGLEVITTPFVGGYQELKKINNFTPINCIKEINDKKIYKRIKMCDINLKIYTENVLEKKLRELIV